LTLREDSNQWRDFKKRCAMTLADYSWKWSEDFVECYEVALVKKDSGKCGARDLDLNPPGPRY